MNQTANDLQIFITNQKISARLIRDIGDTPTVPLAAAALGVSTEQIVKTLLFLVRLPNTDEPKPVIVISNGESKVDKGPLAKHFGVGKKKIKLASADVVIDLLGYAPGGVPPFGHRTELPVIMDNAVAAMAEQNDGIIFVGGGDDCTMVEMQVAELIRVTQPLLMTVS